MTSRIITGAAAGCLAIGALLGASAGPAMAQPPMLEYQVTLENLSAGQPLSPAVFATRRGGDLSMFTVGELASAELEAIAEYGSQGPMAVLFSADHKVTDVVDLGVPLTPAGSDAEGLDDSAVFSIAAHPGDSMSFAAMLICTNDGFTGLDRARLPRQGNRVFLVDGYDAGTEDNTEASLDIVDLCSALGPVALAGDPNNNRDDAVDTQPRERVRHHPNIVGGADLGVAEHGWIDPVVKVTVTRVDDAARGFLARLGGVGEVPVVDSDASGRARMRLKGDSLHYKLNVHDIEDVTQAHIHWGLPDQNGPVVAFLFGPVEPTGAFDGRLAEGRIREDDLLGPLEGDFAAFRNALRRGELYVNVHTAANPPGEIRGQIGVTD